MLKHYGHVRDTDGTIVEVQQSSLADKPAVWIGNYQIVEEYARDLVEYIQAWLTDVDNFDV